MPTPDNKRENCSCEPNDNVNFPCNCKCHKRELSACCGSMKGIGECEICAGCGKPFSPQSSYPFLEKTLAELDKVLTDALVKAKIPVYEGYALDIIGNAMESFLHSALNAQRKEIREKVEKLGKDFPDASYRKAIFDVLALLFLNNKENE